MSISKIPLLLNNNDEMEDYMEKYREKIEEKSNLTLYSAFES